MSLTDAFLLDPAPFNVWIAYRGDGAGSGTANDPYDGSTKLASPSSVTLHNVTTDPREALGVVTQGAALQDNDIVIISGATGNDASKWNGTFVVYGASGNNFKYRMPVAPAVVNPVPGTIIAEKILSCPLDDLLASLPANTRVHLGPTQPGRPFQTLGYRVGTDPLTGFGWQIKAGMKIIGSGMDITVLQVVKAATDNNQYFALGHDLKVVNPSTPNPVDGVVVSDLPIDCNVDQQPVNGIACGAIRVMGSHCRIERVKAINWGTGTSGLPCHVFSLIVATANPALLETVNSGIENCIAILPSHKKSQVGC